MTALHIVLLERDHDHAESLLLQLRMNGHAVHVCYSIAECIEAVQRLQPDAVLLNAGLPMPKVYELGYRLRQETQSSAPVVLRISQPGDQIDANRSVESGIRFHLTKPIYASGLQSALETCLA